MKFVMDESLSKRRGTEVLMKELARNERQMWRVLSILLSKRPLADGFR